MQNRLNTALVIEGIPDDHVCDGRLPALQPGWQRRVPRHFDNIVFSTIITPPPEAPAWRKPVILYDASSQGSMNYLNPG